MTLCSKAKNPSKGRNSASDATPLILASRISRVSRCNLTLRGHFWKDSQFSCWSLVRAVESEGVTGELEEALIPQWGIAVIVIGLASLLFVIIFAVTLVSPVHYSTLTDPRWENECSELMKEFNYFSRW